MFKLIEARVDAYNNTYLLRLRGAKLHLPTTTTYVQLYITTTCNYRTVTTYVVYRRARIRIRIRACDIT